MQSIANCVIELLLNKVGMGDVLNGDKLILNVNFIIFLSYLLPLPHGSLWHYWIFSFIGYFILGDIS